MTELRKSQGITQVLEPSTTVLKQKVWKLKTSRKIMHFLWQALAGYIAKASKLVERPCGTDRSCQRCGNEAETINHLLFECPPALQCWALSNIPSSPGVFPCSSLYNNFDYLLQLLSGTNTHMSEAEIFPWLLWFI